MTLLLNRADLEKILDVSSVIDAVERGFADFSAGRSIMPVRTAVRVTDPPGVMLVMPCAMTESGVLGTKIVSVFPRNPTRGLPTIPALYVLLDYSTVISKLADQNTILAQRLAILEEKLGDRS